jgi:azurin
MSTIQQTAVAFAAALALGAAPIDCRAAGEQPIAVSADDAMQFDVTEVTAKAGHMLTFVLTNNGSLMAHNLVILKPGADAAAFAASGARRAADGYLPNDEQASQMLAHTRMLDGGGSDRINFTPPTPGVYEYICTYPGHLAAGMRGKITVR